MHGGGARHHLVFGCPVPAVWCILSLTSLELTFPGVLGAAFDAPTAELRLDCGNGHGERIMRQREEDCEIMPSPMFSMALGSTTPA